MTTADIAGFQVELDAEGFMTDYTQWNRDIALELARQVGIPELTDRHFTVIEFMRREFQEKGTGPSIRAIKSRGGIPVAEIYELFPGGPAKKAAKIAGIPKPHGCM